MTALGSILAGARILAADVQAVAPLAIIKGADQSVTSSVAMQNDDALLVNVEANASYLLLCYLDYEGGTRGASDLKWQWAVPSGASLRYQRLCVDPSSNPQFTTMSTATVGTAGSNGAGVLQGVTMNGTLTTSATPGTLQLQWAQNTSSATATIVHAQSSLALWRIS